MLLDFLAFFNESRYSITRVQSYSSYIYQQPSHQVFDPAFEATPLVKKFSFSDGRVFAFDKGPKISLAGTL
jgi:hypothetical protein